jgi:hypothetical protein
MPLINDVTLQWVGVSAFDRKRGWLVLVGLGVVVASVGAAYLYHAKYAARPDDLESRVRRFWDAKVEGDLAAAYALEQASQTGAVDLGSYLRKRSPAMRYVGYEITSIQQNGETADVEVEFSYQIRYPHAGDVNSATRGRERWVMLNGSWFRETKAAPAPLTPTQ